MLEIVGLVCLGLIALYVLVCAFYFFFQERLIFVPWGQMKRDAPIVLGSAFEEVWMDGIEGGEIHAIHIKTRQPRGCILYFHGNTGGISRWGAIGEELTSFGFDVFLPDYRGYGKSRGLRTEETLYSDALMCYNKVLESFPEEKICIYGRSLGSGIAAWLAARTRPAAVVLETPYNSMIEVATYHSPIIPVKLFLRFTFRSDIHIRRAESPILIAHGTKDKVVPYKSGLSLYNSIKEREHTKMLTIPGGKHGNLNGYPVFRKTLERYFDRYFPK
jgi:alpha-beta hydrolase superfamily lysophospholipase